MGLFSKLLKRHQPNETRQPRGCLPDAETSEAIILIKACDILRLTYEIRLMTFMAQTRQKRFRLLIQRSTVVSPDLQQYAARYNISIEQSTT